MRWRACPLAWSINETPGFNRVRGEVGGMAGSLKQADDSRRSVENQGFGDQMTQGSTRKWEPKTASPSMRRGARDYVRRFPPQGIASTILNIAMVFFGNSLVFWLLLSGELRAAHLIVLVMIETLLLLVISWLVQRAVPRVDWLEQPKPWRETLPILAFVLVWLGGAYAFTLAIIDGFPDVIALVSSVQPWIDARLYIPLLYTLALALLHALGDLRHYRQKGGPFISDVSHDAMARYLTLVLGGIPFAMPFFASAIGGFKGIEYVFGKARVDPARSLLAGAAMVAVAAASFSVIELLIASGVHGWAIGFVFAKLIAEVLVVCMPLIMASVAVDEARQPLKSSAG
jgi:hypothetical protein